jgi:hypothetical protein
MHKRVFGCLVVATFAVPAAAWADAPRFGGAGQLAITDDQPLGAAVGATGLITPTPPGSNSTASFEYATVSDNGGSGTSFVVAPAADYFVISGLSLGANVIFGVLSPAHGNTGSGVSETLFGIAPRVGYALALTDTIAFWPKVYFGYLTLSVSSSGGNGVANPSSGENATAIGIFAPFMFQPAPHFLLGIGPNFSTQLSNNQTSGGTSTPQPKVTQVGVQATIGGWFLGD